MALRRSLLLLKLRHRISPAFSCPSVARTFNTSILTLQHDGSVLLPHSEPQVSASPPPAPLPLQCPGCGAFTQLTHSDQAGYYSSSRKSVKTYLAQLKPAGSQRKPSEAKTFEQVLRNADESLLRNLGLKDVPNAHEQPEVSAEVPTPVCNRCHELVHHRAGVSIVHPTLASIQDIISESPYKYNHIYHVLDSADFPLSLIPRIQQHLSLLPQRSLNRRSKTGKYHHGRKAEMSFIITRSDLLAPKKEQVDSLMPYLIEVLRDALGKTVSNLRLGNVRCVSSKRGWWTKEVKEAIWERGGGGWMVGKVNVGKSNLFECVFPKGRNEEVDFHSLRHAAKAGIGDITESSTESRAVGASRNEELLLEESRIAESDTFSEHSLLPPAPPEERYPVIPVVSSLPGTTASPIRLPFGSGKGELIDLPGLERGSLEDYVQDEHKKDLVMGQRIKSEQISIKPGQSLLAGGLVRITPTNPNQVVLAYPFLPFDCHVTSTEKAISLQNQREPSGVPTIAKPEAADLMRSAGVFQLKWDVTKQRAGPLTRPSAVGLKAQVLPFVIYSADLLIEGSGWIELVVQVRKRELESGSQDPESTYSMVRFPEIEVFSPMGGYIGLRRPMNAWLLGGPKPKAVADRTTRPRRSMKGVKKMVKKLARATADESP